jgi:replication-associated recombination protein RarA
MAVTQEQLQDVREQISDLRVQHAELVGELHVTNQRLNDLINQLNTNRKIMWGLAGTMITTLIAVIARLFGVSI